MASEKQAGTRGLLLTSNYGRLARHGIVDTCCKWCCCYRNDGF